MDLPLRPWTPDEDDAVLAALERAFLDDRDPEHPEPLGMLEHDRTLSAWADGRPVATAGVFSLRTAVPGGVLPVAGVTLVSVQATHRRRGLLRRMMTAQLQALHDDGEAVAALWASEPAIYGRYGYGAASRSLAVEVRRGDLLRGGTPSGGVVEVEPSAELLAPVWDRAFPERPGEYARDERWWAHVLFDPTSRRGGRTALRCALLEDGSGYALFSSKGGWDDRGPAGEVLVRELVGTDGPAQVRLWQHLLGLDLVAVWRAHRLALDDALLGAVADARRLTPRVQDGLFVRLVRVGEALEGRRYAADVDVVLDVADGVLPANARRWHLVAGPSGASCTPTDRAADLALGVEELGATYLGGTTLLSLAAAGRVVEHRAGALAAASRALRGDVEPRCSHVF